MSSPDPTRPLEGRVALVTGAGRGIGRAEALALAAAGARVVVNDLGGAEGGVGSSQGPAQDVAQEIREAGGEAVANTDSVAEWASAQRVVASAVESFGRLDIVVNNAGIVRHQMIEEIDEADFDATIAVNLKGTFAICRHAIPVLRAGGYGRIINTASNQWAAPIGNAHYAASKGGVTSLTYDLAFELQPDGITVNAVAPFALTRMTADAGARDADLQARGLMGATRAAVKEPRADPSLVAPMVVYLASDAAAEISGRVFRVGGPKIGIYGHPSEERTVFRDETDGPWPYDQLAALLPRTLLAGGASRAPHLR
ncbi:MAG: SDR family NAD(P)-dependent oxidoreductase [Pseudonocardia sp.]|uniref:SDR family NAD(P)-dependent oxidoreductase n=1 Tax=unclassified Pseudonocardia TaxID=2619320 RepID=UPI00086B13F1|nr:MULTISPECIES: SDR family NAD(P)-dependent oxidoreductase [unclassified Pseudonocardia]MBN9108363.1 SDR family NAD(P)-dependent oxidoreductase [Pseudonocardia sp.]ODU30342.1 MAG: short-chain dehydrogenase [Pseudonocardia sp. SCN 72-51]ODV08739.1 MAG: short-chain dehydrogenase [Pseudonocardia sp. SCN 73-27]